MEAAKQSVAQPAAAKQESAGRAVPALKPLALMGAQLGNSAMRIWLQAKLKVSAPQDLYEQEADRVADQVMRQAPVQIQRACNKCEEEDKLNRSAEADGTPVVTAATENAIAGLSGRGQELPEDIRSFMEPRFDADFSGVRIHTDSHADELARSVDAQAFTVGRNVVFGAGHYAPNTERGKRLLAHELTHVIQQQGGQRSVQRRPDSQTQFGGMGRTPGRGQHGSRAGEGPGSRRLRGQGRAAADDGALHPVVPFLIDRSAPLVHAAFPRAVLSQAQRGAERSSSSTTSWFSTRCSSSERSRRRTWR